MTENKSEAHPISSEQELKYKCIARYPHSMFIVGETYTNKECCEILNPKNVEGCLSVFDCLKYPAIFQSEVGEAHPKYPDQKDFVDENKYWFEKYPKLQRYIQEYANTNHFSSWTGFLQELEAALQSGSGVKASEVIEILQQFERSRAGIVNDGRIETIVKDWVKKNKPELLPNERNDEGDKAI